MDWADLDADGDLDAVTASYDIGLLTELGNEYLLKDEAGVYIHWNEAGEFRAQRLAEEAQGPWPSPSGMKTGDGRLDLLVGNDFRPAGSVLAQPRRRLAAGVNLSRDDPQHHEL